MTALRYRYVTALLAILACGCEEKADQLRTTTPGPAVTPVSPPGSASGSAGSGGAAGAPQGQAGAMAAAGSPAAGAASGSGGMGGAAGGAAGRAGASGAPGMDAGSAGSGGAPASDSDAGVAQAEIEEWRGTTSQNRDIEFEISGGSLIWMRLAYAFPPFCDGDNAHDFKPPVPIGEMFSVSLLLAGATNLTFAGRFTDDGNGSGTLTFMSPIDPDQPECGIGTINWTASRQ